MVEVHLAVGLVYPLGRIGLAPAVRWEEGEGGREVREGREEKGKRKKGEERRKGAREREYT